MRCEMCEMVPLIEIKNQTEYDIALSCVQNMLNAGAIEMLFQTCPIENVKQPGDKYISKRIFHQFRCKNCGTIYGMLCSPVTGGGEIKINAKPYNPDDYTKKEEK